MFNDIVAHTITVKPVLRGPCIKGSPALNSHLFWVPRIKYSGNEPVLCGHVLSSQQGSKFFPLRIAPIQREMDLDYLMRMYILSPLEQNKYIF